MSWIPYTCLKRSRLISCRILIPNFGCSPLKIFFQQVITKQLLRVVLILPESPSCGFTMLLSQSPASSRPCGHAWKQWLCVHSVQHGIQRCASPRPSIFWSPFWTRWKIFCRLKNSRPPSLAAPRKHLRDLGSLRKCYWRGEVFSLFVFSGSFQASLRKKKTTDPW
jgi:hypothetical protein